MTPSLWTSLCGLHSPSDTVVLLRYKSFLCVNRPGAIQALKDGIRIASGCWASGMLSDTTRELLINHTFYNRVSLVLRAVQVGGTECSLLSIRKIYQVFTGTVI